MHETLFYGVLRCWSAASISIYILYMEIPSKKLSSRYLRNTYPSLLAPTSWTAVASVCLGSMFVVILPLPVLARVHSSEPPLIIVPHPVSPPVRLAAS